MSSHYYLLLYSCICSKVPRKGRGNVNNSQRHLRSLSLSFFSLFFHLFCTVFWQKISPPSLFKRNLIVFWQKAKAMAIGGEDYKASAGCYPSFKKKLTWSGYWANNSIVCPELDVSFLFENLLGKHAEKRKWGEMKRKSWINRLIVDILKWKLPEQLRIYYEMRWMCEKIKEHILELNRSSRK